MPYHFLPETTYRFHIYRHIPSERFLQYLAARMKTRLSWVNELLDDGHICHNGVTLSAAAALSKGDLLEVYIPKYWPGYMAPTPLRLEVLFEDEFILALNKPSGIVVHPARGHLSGDSLQNAVRHRCREYIGHENITISACHRLDRDTTGVIIFSRTTEAFREMVYQFSKHKVRKTYHAMISGLPSWSECIFDQPIGIDPSNSKKHAIMPDGKSALTHVRVLESGSSWALIEAVCLTGRPHQIRVHLSSAGYPLFGDDKYNPFYKASDINRQALHASCVEFDHPITQKPLSISAPLPSDMNELLLLLHITENMSI